MHDDDPPLKPIIESAAEHDPAYLGLSRLAWLMDRSVHVPGTQISVGLDAILGLFPLAGDVVTGLIQTGIVLVAVHHFRVPKPIAMRMAANVLLDTVVGSVPLVGDAFDVAFKANTRNLALLERVIEQRARHQRVEVATSVAWLTVIAVILLGTVGLVLVGLIAAIRWLFQGAPV